MSTPTRRWRLRLTTLLPGFSLAAGLALVPSTPASAQSGPSIAGDLSGNAIRGCDFTPFATVGEEIDQTQGGTLLWAGAISTWGMRR